MVERPPLLTVPETARMLRCGRDKVYDLLNRGDLEGVMLDGRRRIVRESLDTFLRRLRGQEALPSKGKAVKVPPPV